MARKQDRRKASPAAAILTVLVLAALFVWRMLGSPEDGKTQITLPNGELHVWFLDVGQADSSLLVCDGQAMLIDGGNVDDASYVVASLEQYGVTSLDYVINTHCDEDHVGGLAGVLAKFPAEHEGVFQLCEIRERAGPRHRNSVPRRHLHARRGGDHRARPAARL